MSFLASSFGKVVLQTATQATIEAAKVAGRRLQAGCDPLNFQREADKMRGILENPPPVNSNYYTLQEYRRIANDALNWIRDNIPEEYEHYKSKFLEYTIKVTPQVDRQWSCGKYSHNYSYGSPYSGAEKFRRLIVQNGNRVALHFNADEEIVRHNFQVLDAEHERFFRQEYGLSDTPPPTDQEERKQEFPILQPLNNVWGPGVNRSFR